MTNFRLKNQLFSDLGPARGDKTSDRNFVQFITWNYYVASKCDTRELRRILGTITFSSREQLTRRPQLGFMCGMVAKTRKMQNIARDTVSLEFLHNIFFIFYWENMIFQNLRLHLVRVFYRLEKSFLAEKNDCVKVSWFFIFSYISIKNPDPPSLHYYFPESWI